MFARTKISPVLVFGLLAVMALITASCTISRSTPVQGTISIPNALGAGSSDDGILVTFLEVVSDSRCAEGVVCVDAGKAEIRIGYSVDGGAQQTTVVEMLGEQSASFNAGNRFLIELLRLLPSTPPVGGVEQGDYQLELRITER